MSRGGKGLARGPRLVEGEKRCVTVRASITPSLADRADEWCTSLSVSRSLLVEMALGQFLQMLEAGQVASGPIQHWRSLILGTRNSIARIADAAAAEVQALDLICTAATFEAVEVDAPSEEKVAA